MNNQKFSLQPFGDAKLLPNLKITGSITRHANQLNLCYMLSGDLEKVAIAPPSNTPQRKHELWKNTCFEFFLGVKDSDKYWEFNLSPTGNWNIYRFDRYRQGMQEEIAFSVLPFNVQHQPNGLVVVLEMDLNSIVLAEEILQIAITTVIKCKDGEVTYWALTHQGKEADFHLRDSFIIDL
ncbi:MAG: DOMON-like domain-containing protein [Fischerella sp. CENA71]|nr:DOMON-like domain-containing protein [Fischerella sp. CENA71]